MLEPIVASAVVALAVLLFGSLYRRDRVRRREALHRWAAASGYRLIAHRQPVLTEASPFPFAVSKAQQVFRVEVEGPTGGRRSGWVRLGSPWRGLSSPAADVRWNAAWRGAETSSR